MPFKSQQQAKMFYARANSRPSKERKFGKGPSPEVAKKFIADSGKQDISALPHRVKKK
jgi:hypothetical protein